MKKINEIPQWMEKYIPLITNGVCYNINEIEFYLSEEFYLYNKVIREINIKIDFLHELQAKNII